MHTAPQNGSGEWRNPHNCTNCPVLEENREMHERMNTRQFLKMSPPTWIAVATAFTSLAAGLFWIGWGSSERTTRVQVEKIIERTMAAHLRTPHPQVRPLIRESSASKERVARVEVKLNGLGRRFDRLDQKLDKILERLPRRK